VKSPAELTELFRQRGLKVTPQRVSVFEVLHDNRTHPTAEAVYAAVREEMPTISLRTVYQTLNDLASMGEIGQLDLGTGSARFDPNLDAHHHLVCEACGEVTDVYADFTDVRLSRHKLRGFQVSSTEIVFRGRCAACSSAPERGIDAH
jgi:Fur family transcriptional regulator, peroxide stress response regulator